MMTVLQQPKMSQSQLIHMYDQAADRWNATLRRLGWPCAYEDLFAQLDERGFLAGLGAGSPILDCGIGTGALTHALIRRVGAGITCHGVDISVNMLTEARRMLTNAGAPHHLKQHDVCTLPYDDATFSFVMGAHVLEHLSDPCAGLHEMIRVLAPGAPLLIVMTRRGLLGRLIGHKWGNTCVAPGRLRGWLEGMGLRDVALLPIGGRLWCRTLSVASIGRKP